jgi:hypothetical protein
MRADLVDGVLALLTRAELEQLAERVQLRLRPPPTQPMDPDDDGAAWWRQKLVDGRLLPDRPGWPEWVLACELADDFALRAEGPPDLGRRANAMLLGLLLQRVCQPRVRKRTVPRPGLTSRGKRMTSYELPPLEECRARWRDLMGEEPWADQGS